MILPNFNTINRIDIRSWMHAHAGCNGHRVRFLSCVERELLSIEDYVLVSSERLAVEVHHRDRKQNCWITRIYGPGDTVKIESLNAEFLMDEIYERTHFKQM